MKITTPEAMRDLERRAVESGACTWDGLMERAGLLAARCASALTPGSAPDQQLAFMLPLMSLAPSAPDSPRKIVALVGPGNNGGDGLVAARHLQRWHGGVTAIVVAPRPDDDPKARLAIDAGVAVVGADDDPLAALARTLPDAAVVIDGMLGIGAARPLEGAMRDAAAAVAAERARRPSLRVLALDVPTGVDAATGAVDLHTLTADVTVTFGLPKHAHFAFPAAAHTGALIVADIGIPPDLADDGADELVTGAWVRERLPARPRDAHKGTFGRVLTVAGSPSYVGAACLACLGATRAGAGYVTLAVTPRVQALVTGRLVESTFLLLPEDDETGESAAAVRDALSACDALLVGCGLGQSPGTQRMLERLLLDDGAPIPVPAIIDADALNYLAATPGWERRLRADAVVTPHPGEMARLLGCTIAEVERDRIGAARQAAADWRVTVLLKGAFTVAAEPGGPVRVLPFANPALATAGSGDVLAGAMAAMAAQGMPLAEAASAAAYVHGAAGELAARDIGAAGVIASDLLPRLPQAITAVRAGDPLSSVHAIA